MRSHVVEVSSALWSVGAEVGNGQPSADSLRCRHCVIDAGRIIVGAQNQHQVGMPLADRSGCCFKVVSAERHGHGIAGCLVDRRAGCEAFHNAQCRRTRGSADSPIAPGCLSACEKELLALRRNELH